MGIEFFLMVNKQGQTRLAQYFFDITLQERTTLESELKRIQGLKDDGLVSNEDYDSLRSKTMSQHSGNEDISENDSLKMELDKLQQMHKSGIINTEELAVLRKKTLGI